MRRINIKEEKNKIRTEYKEKRKNVPSEQRVINDEKICKKLLSLSSYRFADTILLYSPLKNEIDTSAIVKDALSKGKRVAYPRCIEGNEMVYHIITSEEQLISGKYGIKEPIETLPVYENGQDNAICILPAIVYDKKGYRLGYGKGYYDRFLSKFKGIKIGLVYSGFVLDEIPKGKFDLKSDLIITEKGVISFAKN
ncbi:MAG: 5-formyltetrahydrofolate cyclo-ligase [Ruminococcaceae bacterium]|nr:5-formyltetrahydrofolate cyclo-ligase [Oscillospiraceae bacterium]